MKDYTSDLRNVWYKRLGWRSIKIFVQFSNGHSTVFLCKSISVKQIKTMKNKIKTMANNTVKSNKRFWYIVLSLSLLFFKNQIQVRPFKIVSLASMLLWGTHLRWEVTHSSGPRALFKCQFACVSATWLSDPLLPGPTWASRAGSILSRPP